MSGLLRTALGAPALLEFRGPDAERFLNGQLTQDVRLVAGGKLSLPSCVTDAKGKLQFRVTVLENAGALWVATFDGGAAELEARLTRYLISDDAECADLTGKFEVHHFGGAAPEPPPGVLARAADRFGIAGTDWWVPAGFAVELPGAPWPADEREETRIFAGIPAWGKELQPGMLPPEALLDRTDISYRKGCYIGQEVISRIKSAGKTNRRLTRFDLPADCGTGPLFNADGAPAGEITSVSPLARGGVRHALGFLKRGAGEVFLAGPDGVAERVEAIAL